MQYILNSGIKLNQHTVITEAEFERVLFDEAIKDINIIVFVVIAAIAVVTVSVKY